MNIYKVNYLTGVNRIQKIYVFSGEQDKDLASLFKMNPVILFSQKYLIPKSYLIYKVKKLKSFFQSN